MASNDSNAPGTDGPPPGGPSAEARSRSELIRALTISGWLAFAGWLAFLLYSIDRAVRINSASRFAGVWDERIEAISFNVFPQHVIVLLPAVVAAVVGTWLAGPLQEFRSAVLLRICRWASSLCIAVAAISVVSIATSDSQGLGERGSLAFRLGGALIAASFIVVLRAAERSSPGA